jgi:hypothetical protein
VSDEDPEIPDPLANIDQAIAGLATRAHILRGYYVALVENNFTEEQALEIVVSYQNLWPI